MESYYCIWTLRQEAIVIGTLAKPEYTRTASSIMMLQILYSRDLVSISELAKLLQTNPRNIPEYKKELQYAGYVIESVPGRYGGYRLARNFLLPSLKLDPGEQGALLRGFDYLLQRNDFFEKEQFGKAMAKISAILVRGKAPSKAMIVNRFPLKMPEQELAERYEAVLRCINEKRSIEIEYLSQKNVPTKYLFNPYKLFMYNNAWCVLGQCRQSEYVIYLKLNRIRSYRITDQKFFIPLTYAESDYLDEYGMKKNGDWYPIKLKITGPYAMLVTERVFGKDQIVRPIDESTTILSCTMQNEEAICKFVLGFGIHCEVLEPPWLRERIVESLQATMKIYQLTES